VAAKPVEPSLQASRDSVAKQEQGWARNEFTVIFLQRVT
jgi:hypothetical protein